MDYNAWMLAMSMMSNLLALLLCAMAAVSLARELRQKHSPEAGDHSESAK